MDKWWQIGTERSSLEAGCVDLYNMLRVILKRDRDSECRFGSGSVRKRMWEGETVRVRQGEVKR